jgi:orsellinic acid C2-O-methyltransferase
VSVIPLDALRLLNGFRGYQLVVAASRLKLPDLVASSSLDAREIAERTGTNPDAMRRMLRGLVAWGFFSQGADGRYSSTAISDAFRADRPGLRNMALMLSDEAYPIWRSLMYTLETGEPAFEHVHGRSRWEILAEKPEEAALFNAAMVEASSRGAADVVASYDFSGTRSIVDVGGGNGALLAGVLRANPGVRGVLFDLAAGLDGAADAMAAAGVADRVEIMEGSFFESVPSGKDVYLLKSIVHDWDDEHSVKILATCRAAMVAASTRLLVIDRVVPEHVSADGRDIATVMSDLHMMVLLGGRERTTAELIALFEPAGLKLTQDIEMPSGFHIVEARPA